MKLRKYRDLGFSEMLKLKIKSFNNEKSKYHKLSREVGYVKHFQIEESSEDGFIGGLAARVYWNCMFIDDFFIEENHRGKSLGSRMLNAAEEFAKEESCRFIVLNTFGFQAKSFYEKNGYKVVGEIKDYPPGDSYFTMRKEL